MKLFIHFGIISAMLMAEMQVYVLIIFCLVHTLTIASLLPVLTGMSVVGKRPVTMPLFGLNWRIKKIKKQEHECAFCMCRNKWRSLTAETIYKNTPGLAKSSYHCITDPENFNEIAD